MQKMGRGTPCEANSCSSQSRVLDRTECPLGRSFQMKEQTTVGRWHPPGTLSRPAETDCSCWSSAPRTRSGQRVLCPLRGQASFFSFPLLPLLYYGIKNTNLITKPGIYLLVVLLGYFIVLPSPCYRVGDNPSRQDIVRTREFSMTESGTRGPFTLWSPLSTNFSSTGQFTNLMYIISQNHIPLPAKLME